MYTKHLSEPWFSLTKLSLKTVEGRLRKGDFASMAIGDHITFTNTEFGFTRAFVSEIIDLRVYPSFRAYLEQETLARTLPGIETLDDGLAIYRRYYTEEDEQRYTVLALTLRPFRPF